MWPKCDIRIRTLLCYILSLSSLCSGYIITTPRRWTSGEESQVCITLSEPAATQQTITFEMKKITWDYYPFPAWNIEGELVEGEEEEEAKVEEEEEESTVLIPATSIVIPEETHSICQKIYLPITEEYSAEFTITGSLEGKNISYTKTVAISSEIYQTFIQTDKYLYKPSQIVQFRILTIFGAFLQVSLEPYKEIWIESPSGIRLEQWSDVFNGNGLIHLSFQLSDEPEEGIYKIKLMTLSGKIYNRAFKVEEYVLPRFEVSIKPPDYVLGNADEITFEVCATYTFGQPVKGNASISVNNNGWGNYSKIVKENKLITDTSGCTSFTFTANDVSINNDNAYYSYGYLNTWGYNAYSLTVNAVFTEDGTGINVDANEISVNIIRTALRFKDIGIQKYSKPEFPYAGEVEVTFPDGSPTPNEPMIVCCEELCKNMSTDAEGILTFAIPPHLDCDIRIRAPGYPAIVSNETGSSIMYKSGFFKSLRKYYSPSNSSLLISIPNDELECTSTEDNIFFNLTVMFAVNQQESALVTVHVVSRGQIQFSKTFDISFTAGSTTSIPDELFIEPVQESSTPGVVKGSFTVIINLLKTVSPEAQVLVWYTRGNGEIVSDCRYISIMECLLNSVEVKWSTEKAQPGSNTSVTVKAEPLSLCSLGVVDKSVELLTPKKYLLTLIRFLNLAKKASVGQYDYPQVDDYNYCQNQQIEEYPTDTTTESSISPSDTTTQESVPSSDTTSEATPTPSDTTAEEPSRRKKRNVMASKLGSERVRRSFIGGPWIPYSSYYYVDSLSSFDEAGVYILSDNNPETRPCVQKDYGYSEYNSYTDYNFIDDYTYGEELPNYFGGGMLFALEGIPEDDTAEQEISEPKETESNDVRTYFPETWIWSLFNISSDGLYEENLILPDTVSEWVGRAVCINPSAGVGVSFTATIITFKEFFVDLTLPPSVKRGEIFTVKISIFNYLNDSLPIKLTLKSPEENFDILNDSGDTVGSGERNTCVPIKDKTVVSIRIRAKEVGDVNISATAVVEANVVEDCGPGNVQQKTDSLIKPIQVKFEGISKEKSESKYVCTNGSGPTVESWNVTAPDSIVLDSARGYVAVSGDLMGPTLENLGNLIRLPTGCGEQNMLNFAPNIFVIQYLDASSQNTAAIKSKAIDFMRKGYQQELNYRLSDGSFSAFGESDGSGSTWLTAFVLKCFGQATPYISIDLNDLSVTANWLKSKQQSNGCFESVGRVIHKEMQGGSGSESPSLLTAYVLIALIESGEDIGSTSVVNALTCIKNDADPNTNSYNLAIKAYALALANSTDANEAIQELLNLSTTSDGSLSFPSPQGSESVAVETASYAVLAILTFAKTNPSTDFTQSLLPIIKWTNTQRNGQGGFISTQDSVIALQALAAYQKTISSSQGPLDLSVSVTMDPINKSFNINDQNKLVQQSVGFPSVPTTVIFNITGKGCVLIQSVLRYNVPEGEKSGAFSLSVNTSTEPDKECKTKRIEVCAAYLLPNQSSNMAIIQIDLVSGYIQEKEDLDKIIGDGFGLFKRYETDRSTILIYVNEFSSKELCVSFRIRREGPVENLKPGTVQVYDQYKPEDKVSETYTLPPPTECNEGKEDL